MLVGDLERRVEAIEECSGIGEKVFEDKVAELLEDVSNLHRGSIQECYPGLAEVNIPWSLEPDDIAALNNSPYEWELERVSDDERGVLIIRKP